MAKLTGDFKDFLFDTVNLNQTRINLLDERVKAIQSFLRDSDFTPAISTFIEHGSWAHDTIIRPVDGGEFDADLLVRVKKVEGWGAAQYVKDLGRVFLDSSRYSDKTVVCDYCVTITYADECKIDIAPLVMDRVNQGDLEVCNKGSDQFEESQPVEYTRWIRQQNGYSGNNSFRKATRLVKYIRDIKKRFSCRSVLLTTLIGQRIDRFDKGSDEFEDTPTALQTIIGRLDEWLQDRPDKPEVLNPALASQDFADLWNDIQYANFRNFVHKYRGWIDDAMSAETRAESIEKWRRVFGDDFAKGENVKKSEATASQQALAFLKEGAAHLEDLVDSVVDFGINILPAAFRTPAHLQRPTWERASYVTRSVHILAGYSSSKSSRGYRISTGEAMPARGGIWFDVRVNKFEELGPDHYVRWRITNTGAIAMALNQGRGGFEKPQDGNRRWESLQYRGVHMAEAFVIRRGDHRLVGYSDPFYVVVR